MGEIALLLRQAAHQDRDKDDVVDAQDDLQGGQGARGDPRFQAGYSCKHDSFREKLNVNYLFVDVASRRPKPMKMAPLVRFTTLILPGLASQILALWASKA